MSALLDQWDLDFVPTSVILCLFDKWTAAKLSLHTRPWSQVEMLEVTDESADQTDGIRLSNFRILVSCPVTIGRVAHFIGGCCHLVAYID